MFAKIVRLSYWLVPILLVGFCPLSLNAQTTAAPEKEKEKTAATHHMQSVTGCLQKGDEPDEFSITGEDGKSWELHSKTVKLEEHLGHKITVTGSPIHESAKERAKERAEERAEEKKEGKMEKAAGKEEVGDLRVTSVKMISETCTK
jgi:hypothetical protein